MQEDMLLHSAAALVLLGEELEQSLIFTKLYFPFENMKVAVVFRSGKELLKEGTELKDSVNLLLWIFRLWAVLFSLSIDTFWFLWWWMLYYFIISKVVDVLFMFLG